MQRNGKAPASKNGALLDEALPPSATITLLDTEAREQPAPAAPQPAMLRKLGAGVGDSIDARLLAARVAIGAVMADPAMQDSLALYGYDAERMRAGQVLYERALALHQRQQAGYGERYAATDARDAAQAQAHTAYMRYLAVARVALRGDRGAARALGLAQTRKRSNAGWLSQAQQFYANALGDSAIGQRLAAFGATHSQLSAGQQLVAAAATKLVAQQTSREAALALTKQRDAALAAMGAWMRDFRAIARVALES
jgi:hypothetical protein